MKGIWGGVGEQNLPPQNVSLACGLLQAENNQGLKTREETDLLTN